MSASQSFKMAPDDDERPISKVQILCCICSSPYRQPKMLDCLDSFCLKCIQELRHCQDPDSPEITCPKCREVTSITNMVEELPDDFTMSFLVTEFLLQDQLKEGQGSEIKCQACDEEGPAISWCMDCNHFLCQHCQKAHKRLSMIKNHTIHTLDQLRSGKATYRCRLQTGVAKCREHPNDNLNIFCDTCKQLLCTACSVLGHVGHTLLNQTKVADQCKEDIDEMAAKASANIREVYVASMEVNKSRKKLDAAAADTKEKISRKANEEVEKIKEERDNLRQEVDRLYQERVEMFDKAQTINSKEIKRANSKLRRVDRLVQQASCSEILYLKPKLFSALEELIEKRAARVPEDLTFMDFREVERQFPRLGDSVWNKEDQPTGKWSLKWRIKQIGQRQIDLKDATQVAAFSNNDIVILDASLKQMFSVRRDPEALVVTEWLQIDDLINPTHVSVNKKDQLVVLDGSVVKTFSRDCQLVHQFQPGKHEGDKPTCLAVNNTNLIAVGYRGTKTISVHTPDGIFLSQMAAPMIDSHLAMGDKQLIYTNTKRKMVLAVNNSSCQESQMQYVDKLTGGPAGVCFDSEGSLFVAVRRQFLNSLILHVFSDKESNKFNMKKSSWPRGITITQAGELVVATGRSVHIYEKIG